MFLIAGLGNPGVEYVLTRHNAGFLAVDILAARWHFPAFKKAFDGQTSQGVIGGQKCLLLKPETFMNESGNAVAKALHFYKLASADLIVVHDELDLPFGTVRAKMGGGTAGHNGLNSIVHHTGQDFARVRVGIDKKDVLGRFNSDEMDKLPDILSEAAAKVEALVAKAAGAAEGAEKKPARAKKAAADGV
ncbi:hypothetical protein FACS1894186_1890 [Alphaproteobacteria bacterium]|nr:hypothetical protein FACS1894186_1890 [Alphaproteobacteria bacterium]